MGSQDGIPAMFFFGGGGWRRKQVATLQNDSTFKDLHLNPVVGDQSLQFSLCKCENWTLIQCSDTCLLFWDWRYRNKQIPEAHWPASQWETLSQTNKNKTGLEVLESQGWTSPEPKSVQRSDHSEEFLCSVVVANAETQKWSKYIEVRVEY